MEQIYYYCPKCGRKTDQMALSQKKHLPTYEEIENQNIPMHIQKEILICPCGTEHTWFSLMTSLSMVTEWSKDHSYGKEENLFIKKLRLHFNDDQIINILNALDEICTECWDTDHPCYCCKDE